MGYNLSVNFSLDGPWSSEAWKCIRWLESEITHIANSNKLKEVAKQKHSN